MPDLPPEAMEQLRLANRLWNDLVAIEHDADEQREAIWAAHATVGAITARIGTLEAELEVLAQADARRRMEAQSRRVKASPEVVAKRKELKELRSQRKDAKATAKAQVVQPLADLAEQAKARRKALYATYCQEQALYWATYNDVLQRFDTTRKRIIDARTQGKPAQMRFRRFTGEGTLAVQLQRGNGDPVRSPELLADPTGRYRNVFRFGSWHDPNIFDNLTRADQRAAGRTTVSFSIGQGRVVALPVAMHRQLPKEADVTNVTITRRLEADRPKITVQVTYRCPRAPDALYGRPRIAVHFGWRSMVEGVRVAVIGDGTNVRDVFVDESVERQLDHADRLRSKRDQLLVQAGARVREWCRKNGVTPPPVHVWRTFRSPIMWMRDTGHDPGITDLMALHRKLWRKEAAIRRKALNRRKDHYRVLAHELATTASEVVVDATDLREFARRSESSDLPERDDAATTNRRNASPSELRLAVVNACKAHQVPVVKATPNATWSTHDCGTVLPAEDREISAVVVCPGCYEKVDQDHLTVRALL